MQPASGIGDSISRRIFSTAPFVTRTPTAAGDTVVDIPQHFAHGGLAVFRLLEPSSPCETTVDDLPQPPRRRRCGSETRWHRNGRRDVLPHICRRALKTINRCSGVCGKASRFRKRYRGGRLRRLRERNRPSAMAQLKVLSDLHCGLTSRFRRMLGLQAGSQLFARRLAESSSYFVVQLPPGSRGDLPGNLTQRAGMHVIPLVVSGVLGPR